MTLSISDFFLAMTLINFSMLTLWSLALIVGNNALISLHARIFRLDNKDVRLIHFKAMAYYKIGTVLLCLVPYIAVEIIS